MERNCWTCREWKGRSLLPFASRYSLKCREDRIYLYKKIWGFDFKKSSLDFWHLGIWKIYEKPCLFCKKFKVLIYSRVLNLGCWFYFYFLIEISGVNFWLLVVCNLHNAGKTIFVKRLLASLRRNMSV